MQFLWRNGKFTNKCIQSWQRLYHITESAWVTNLLLTYSLPGLPVRLGRITCGACRVFVTLKYNDIKLAARRILIISRPAILVEYEWTWIDGSTSMKLMLVSTCRMSRNVTKYGIDCLKIVTLFPRSGGTLNILTNLRVKRSKQN